MLIAIDLGNSAVKVLTEQGEMHRISYAPSWEEKLCAHIESLKHHHVCHVGIISVNPGAYQRTLTTLTPLSRVHLNTIQSESLRHSAIDFSGVEGMGLDRQCGLVGALTLAEPPLISIDCGTAITINVLDADRECLGGAILPGMGTALRSLHDYTGQLPLLEAEHPDLVVGRNTAAAMQIGAVQGAAGAVMHLVDEIVKQTLYNKETTIFITGGHAKLMLAGMRAWHRKPVLVNDLVCRGVISLLENIRQ